MRTGGTEQKEYKTEIKKRQSVGNILENLCHMGVYIFLFFFVVVYSFYVPEGYIQIATNKYLFFRKMCFITAGIMIPLVTLSYMVLLPEKSAQKISRQFSLTDTFVFLFLLVNLISFYFTQYREEAIWGTSGWYMGLAMHGFFIGIYFMMSRLYDGKIDVLPIFMVVVSVIFLWGLLNRFSIYPVDMQYDNVSFISSMGNINWFCGFWSVFFVIGVVLYVVTEKKGLRIFSGIYSVLALGLGVVEGSDSAFISMGVVFYFLFLVSFRKTEYMKRWLEEGMFYCIACQAMRVVASFGPEDPTQVNEGWMGLNLAGPVVEMMLGNLTLAALVLLGILRVLLGQKDRKYQKEIRMNVEAAEYGETELVQEWRWLKYGVIGVTAAVAAIYLTLLIINTKTPGILGPLSKYRILLFDGNWGSNRGATWRDGLLIYGTLSWRERLFGVGQDCFSIYGYSVPELEARFIEEWPNSRLTNAHNECITYLVNVGIFGMLSFIGIFYSSVRRLIEGAKKEPVCYVFAASLLSYFFHNQFSFSQVLNIPYIFMMLGLAESVLRRENDSKV